MQVARKTFQIKQVLKRHLTSNWKHSFLASYWFTKINMEISCCTLSEQVIDIVWLFNTGQDNKNSLLGLSKGWCQPLNKGDSLIEVRITVIKGSNFQNFDNWPLYRGWPLTCNAGPLNRQLQKHERTGTSFLYWLDWKSKHFNWNVTEWKATQPSLRVFHGKLFKWEPCKVCKMSCKSL